MPVPDSELVERARAGDRKAFSRLVSRYRKDVLRMVRPNCRDANDAEDVVQEAFLRAFKSIARLDRAEAFRSWVVAIAQHVAMDHHRATKRRRAHLETLEREKRHEAREEVEDPRIEEIQKAITKLKPRNQRVLELRYKENLSYKDIAQVTRLPESTIRGILARSIAALRKKLGGVRTGAQS